MYQQNTKDLIKSIEHFQNQHILINIQVTTFNVIRHLGKIYANFDFTWAFLWFKPEKPLESGLGFGLVFSDSRIHTFS